jgi:hypothetical protein
MCSLMLTVHAAPTSVPLVQGACCDICLPVHQKYETELNPPHMNSVLDDNTKGNPRAQMRWVVGR